MSEQSAQFGGAGADCACVLSLEFGILMSVLLGYLSMVTTSEARGCCCWSLRVLASFAILLGEIGICLRSSAQSHAEEESPKPVYVLVVERGACKAYDRGLPADIDSTRLCFQ